MKKTLGIYIHIPFCRSKCRYCDFCSFPNKAGEIRAYCDELCRRIEQWGKRAYGREVDTVYFGGGTPSLLPIEEIARIMSTLRWCFELSRYAEITLECNPATADKAYFDALRALGINRLSVGLQSAVEGELALLGRAHGVKEFERCFFDAREAGFDNISVDLMYGIPEQTTESLMYSADYLISLSPEHISAYGLTVEDGTYFARHRGELRLADDDTQADMYHALCKRLADSGYEKYEISNFARNSFESRHNMRYWRCGEYLGFGIAAHSFFDGERFGNSRDIEAFLRGEDIVAQTQMLSEAQRCAEYIMLGLRLCKGIDAREYKELFGRELFEDIEFQKYVDGGFMVREKTRVFFTEKGFLVSNAILADILP